MTTDGELVLLRIIVGESDTWKGKGLASALVEEARAQGLAGATVLRGFEGFGAHGKIHTTHLVDITPDLPMLVEIVDDAAKVEAFLPTVKQMVTAGIATLEHVTAVIYRGAGPTT